MQRLVAGNINALQSLINEIEEPFKSAITKNRELMLLVVEMLDDPTDFPMDQVRKAAIQKGFKHHWEIGICNGSVEIDSGRAWADLHVTGTMGASLDNGVLIERLEFISRLFSMANTWTGVEGEMELHPTGAVVTKQLIMLLSAACGKGSSKVKGNAMMTFRKTFRKKVARNKLAPKIDNDLLPEYFAFLESLQGVAGLKIVPTGGMEMMPEGIQDMEDDEQVAAFNQDMLENSDSGKARLSQYERVYREAEPEMVPSMRVYIKARHIGALLEVLRSQ